MIASASISLTLAHPGPAMGHLQPSDATLDAENSVSPPERLVDDRKEIENVMEYSSFRKAVDE